ncbi:uncharacterized protein LOC122747450 [Dromiciops gliroides]|uniref:uncharacterized protein LOC122747450 n=1 Tax=Dromiciops gliroides TaxID=33562 RepID=UPI001CC3C97D|nr:uncharacterized protein LOC122747450 [Dromiciops gliroides]
MFALRRLLRAPPRKEKKRRRWRRWAPTCPFGGGGGGGCARRLVDTAPSAHIHTITHSFTHTHAHTPTLGVRKPAGGRAGRPAKVRAFSSSSALYRSLSQRDGGSGRVHAARGTLGWLRPPSRFLFLGGVYLSSRHSSPPPPQFPSNILFPAHFLSIRRTELGRRRRQRQQWRHLRRRQHVMADSRAASRRLWGARYQDYTHLLEEIFFLMPPPVSSIDYMFSTKPILGYIFLPPESQLGVYFFSSITYLLHPQAGEIFLADYQHLKYLKDFHSTTTPREHPKNHL